MAKFVQSFPKSLFIQNLSFLKEGLGISHGWRRFKSRAGNLEYFAARIVTEKNLTKKNLNIELVFFILWEKETVGKKLNPWPRLSLKYVI